MQPDFAPLHCRREVDAHVVEEGVDHFVVAVGEGVRLGGNSTALNLFGAFFLAVFGAFLGLISGLFRQMTAFSGLFSRIF